MAQFREFLCECDSELRWEDVDRDLIRAWVMRLMEDGIQPSTVNTKLCSIRAFYRFLLLTGRMTTDPARHVQGPKRPKTLPTFMRDKDMNRLLEIMSEGEVTFESSRNRLIILLLYLTGVRRGELIGLNIADVDTQGCQLKVTGKRNKQRIIPFGAELRDAIDEYKALRARVRYADARALLINNKGARMDESQVAKVVRDALGLVTTQKKRTPHVLRHTFATSMLNGGADLQNVKELLGHESVATTEIYTHATFNQLREVYRKAHPRA